MSAIWWYLPGVTRAAAVIRDELSRSVLRTAGLDRVLDDVRRVPDHCLAQDLPTGPDGGPGLLLYPIPVSGDIPRKPGYDPAHQTWRKSSVARCPSSVATDHGPRTTDNPPWLGYDPDAPPAPCDLERRALIGGYQIEDAHDQTWHVPVLRAVKNPRGRLGVSFSWDESDTPRIGVDPRYAELWDRSARAWDLVDKATSVDVATFAQDFSDEDDVFLLTYLLDALAVNYRANSAVWATLDRVRPGWLSQSAASLMLNATVDLFKYHAFLAAQKKTAD